MKQSSKISLGGVTAALSMVFMMLTGIIPMAEYALPALAGMLLIPVMAELGLKWAMTCWGAVSLLSFLIAPVKESAFVYFIFFGYYPVLKGVLESKRRPVMEWTLKFLSLNLAGALSLGLAVLLFGKEAFWEMFNGYPLILAGSILLMNVVFLVYDFALTRLITVYLRYLRPKYIRRFFK